MRRRLPRIVLALLLAGHAFVALSGSDEKINYMLHCQGCHTPDGSGAAGKVPSLKGFMARFLSVPGGREFLVAVPGASQSALSDAELAELTNWMLRTFDQGHLPDDFEPYTPDEVAELRAEPLVNVGVVRAGLVEAMDAVGEYGKPVRESQASKF